MFIEYKAVATTNAGGALEAIFVQLRLIGQNGGGIPDRTGDHDFTEQEKGDSRHRSSPDEYRQVIS